MNCMLYSNQELLIIVNPNKCSQNSISRYTIFHGLESLRDYNQIRERKTETGKSNNILVDQMPRTTAIFNVSPSNDP